jgi:hypothetical protein
MRLKACRPSRARVFERNNFVVLTLTASISTAEHFILSSICDRVLVFVQARDRAATWG